MSSISPKKKFGQNFLKNSETALQIVNFLELKNCNTILEIGPGMGGVISIKNAFEQGLLPNAIDDDIYININRMQSINLK